MRAVPPARRLIEHLTTTVLEYEGTACVLWTASGSATYGTIWVRGVSMTVHAYAYHLAYGIPVGTEVHHRCGTKRCVNVLHLEALTIREHKARHHRGVCARGHRGDWYHFTNGRRRCAACTRELNRNAYRARRARGLPK